MTLDDLLIDAGTELDRLSSEHVIGQCEAVHDPRRPWLGAVAAVALVGAAVGAYAIGHSSSGPTTHVASSTPDVSSAATVAATEPAPTDSTSGTTVATTAPNSSVAAVDDVDPDLDRTITLYSEGADVGMVQTRLEALGFFVGRTDGTFDQETQHAVWAFKTLVLGETQAALVQDSAASAVTPDLWSRMREVTAVVPRRPSNDESTHVEIYLPQQVLAVFRGDTAVLVTHISSGELGADGLPVRWCTAAVYDTDASGQPLDPPVHQNECAESKTPGGIFTANHSVRGLRQGQLGGMYNPVYFNYGIAVHGAKEVPVQRASHGAIRITEAAADQFIDVVDVGDRFLVWGEDGREPEAYTRADSLPAFPTPDPDVAITTP